MVNAPRTAEAAIAGNWDKGYDAMLAVAPAGAAQLASKYWPPVARIDNVYGDRHLVCICPSIDELAS